MIARTREEPMRGPTRKSSELFFSVPSRRDSFSPPKQFSRHCNHPFKSSHSRSSTRTSRPSTSASERPSLSLSISSFDTNRSFESSFYTGRRKYTTPSTPSTISSYPSPFPFYPPSRSPSTFHTRTSPTHSRNHSSSSTSSASSTSSVSSFSSSVSISKPNALTKHFLFHFRPRQSVFGDRFAGMRMLREDEEWEEWGRGVKGVLEPRIGSAWAGVEEILDGGW